MSDPAYVILSANLPEIQNRLQLVDISAMKAGTSLAGCFIVVICSSLLMGFVLCLTYPRVSLSFLAAALTTVTIALVFVKVEVGVLGLGLYGALSVSLRSLYGNFVPPEALGLAGSLMFGSGVIFNCINSALVGLILNYFKGRLGAVLAMCYMIGSFAISACVLLIAWCCFGKSKREDGFVNDSRRLLEEPEK